MKPNFTILLLIIYSLLLTLPYSCKKDPPKVIPLITTTTVLNTTSTSATSGGTIINDGGVSITARGVCWSKSQNPTVSDNKSVNGSGIGNFSVSITNLSPLTTYYVRAYATNSVGTAYGNQVNINTLADIPNLTTISISDITETTATSGGNITNDGGSLVTARGLCWSSNQNPDISDSKLINGSGLGSFTGSITDLAPGTTFYVRAYATNSSGTAYGKEETAITMAYVPSLTTNDMSSVTEYTALSGGNITCDGGAAIFLRGVCWSTNQDPTIQENKTNNGMGTGNFTSTINELTPGTTYFVRAYATNSKGTAYGNQQFVTTLPTLPNIITNPISTLTTTATGGGNITSDGGSAVIARGVCWSKNQSPTLSDSKTNNGSGIGSFTSDLANLTPLSTYYVRAYATNSVGTVYGNQITITTLANLPTIITSQVIAISETTAIGGGNITSDGGAVVTARGACWSISQNPTVENAKTNDGTGTGSFTSNITGLVSNTTYFLRAYATNSTGTAYGNQLTVTCFIKISDIDGNVYNIIKIENQWWMAENLKTTKLNDGTSILNVMNNTWVNVLTPGFCWYNNDIVNKNIYGAIYNGHTVYSQKLCPTGWHVPTDSEWTELTNNLGGELIAGVKLKESGTIHWLAPNMGATNETHFSGLPGGSRGYDGTFNNLGQFGNWWSSSEPDSNSYWYRYLSNNNGSIGRSNYPKNGGLYIRCLKN